jgi:hypothetical protein
MAAEVRAQAKIEDANLLSASAFGVEDGLHSPMNASTAGLGPPLPLANASISPGETLAPHTPPTSASLDESSLNSIRYSLISYPDKTPVLRSARALSAIAPAADDQSRTRAGHRPRRSRRSARNSSKGSAWGFLHRWARADELAARPRVPAPLVDHRGDQMRPRAAHGRGAHRVAGRSQAEPPARAAQRIPDLVKS